MSDQQRAEQIVQQMLRQDAFSQWLGIELVALGPGTATLRMTVRAEMVNGFGVGHGGIVFSFADSAFAFASNTHGRHALALTNSIHYPAPVQVGDVLTAHAAERTLTYRTGTYDVTVTRADGTEVAHFRGTVYRTSTTWEVGDGSG